MSIKKEILSGLFLLIFVALAFSVAIGMNAKNVEATTINASDIITVLVNISKKCIVDISPSSLNWTTPMDPGSEGAYKSIQIENMGSVNLTYVWFNNSYPSSRPFGTGLSTAYDAGNFMTISNNTDGQTYYFPNSVEYNESSPIVYLRGPDSNTPPGVPYGRFRNASREYFWSVWDNNGGNDGNYTNADFYIGSTPHTQTATGDADLSDNAPNTLTLVSTGSEAGKWGVASINVNGMLICVAVYQDASKAMFYKWNMDAPGAESGPGCSNAAYFINGTANGNIMPGASGYARVAPFVPYGVVYNQTQPEITGTITVLVTAQS